MRIWNTIKNVGRTAGKYVSAGAVALGLAQSADAGVIYSDVYDGSNKVSNWTHSLVEYSGVGYTDAKDFDDTGLPPEPNHTGFTTLTSPDNFQAALGDFRDGGSSTPVSCIVRLNSGYPNPKVKFYLGDGFGSGPDMSEFPTDIFFQQTGYAGVDIGTSLRSSGEFVYSIQGPMVGEVTGQILYSNPNQEPTGPVDEPSGLALLALAGAGLAGSRRRRGSRVDEIVSGYQAKQKACNGNCGYDCR